MKDLNLIRKISWSFVKSTGEEFDELFSEAALGYMKAIRSYNSEKAKLSTWAVKIMTNQLITFCAKEKTYGDFLEFFENDIPGQDNIEGKYLFKEWIQNLSQDSQLICKTIFEAPDEILAESSKASRGKLVRKLRSLKWSWSRIWNGVRDIKIALNENKFSGII